MTTRDAWGRNQPKGTSSNDEFVHENMATARFPTLEASLILVHDDDDENSTQAVVPFTLNSIRPLPLETNLFRGTVQLHLKPLHKEHILMHDECKSTSILLDGQDNDNDDNENTFAIEIQGHFLKNLPQSQVYMGAQILKPSLNFGSAWGGQRLCRMLLGLLARHIPGDMRYSFGKSNTSDGEEYEDELPYISFPLTMAMDITTDEDHDKENEQQHCLKTSCRYTIKFSAEKIDLAAWKVQRPFEFPLERLWGKGTPLELIIYHQESPDSPRDYLLRLQIIPKHDQYFGNAESVDKMATPLANHILVTSN